MKNGDLPAMPIQIDGGEQYATVAYEGFSKREELAARFMAAWIIHHGSAHDYGYSSQAAAQCAIDDADTLLANLSAPESGVKLPAHAGLVTWKSELERAHDAGYDCALNDVIKALNDAGVKYE